MVSGSVASLASFAALLLGGRAQSGQALAPVNAPSHWLWGDVALHCDGPSLRYTLVGFAVHHLSSMFWGTVHALVFGGGSKPPRLLLGEAALTTGVAAWVDLRGVPHRLAPGFQRRLSASALAGVYVFFALGLAAGNRLAARGQTRRPLH